MKYRLTLEIDADELALACPSRDLSKDSTDPEIIGAMRDFSAAAKLERVHEGGETTVLPVPQA